MHPLPDCFEDARQRLRRFLQDNGHEGQIVWMLSEDVTSRGLATWIRWPLPEANGREVARLYDAAKSGPGVRLEARCQVAGSICCTLGLPRLDDGETGRLISGLVLCVASPLPVARPVHSGLRWKWLLWRNGIPARTGTAAFIHG